MPNVSQPPVQDDSLERLRLLERALDYLAQENINFARLVLKQRTQRFGEDADGLAHLAMTHARENEFEKAMKLYRKGLQMAEADVAGLSSGDDLWEHVEARPYLRCLHGLGMAQLELAHFDDATRTFQRIMELCPGDPLGARHLLGVILQRQGRVKAAIQIYRKHRSDPMVAYNLALAHFQDGALDQSVLVLRQALLANPYVPAALLEGLPEPFDYPHTRGAEEPEYATAYAGTCGDLWEQTPGGFELLRAVVGCEVVQEDGRSYRELVEKHSRERRRSEKQKLQQKLSRLAGTRRLKRKQAVVLQTVTDALAAAGAAPAPVAG